MLTQYESMIKELEMILTGLEKVVLKDLEICLVLFKLLNLIVYLWN